MRITVNMQPLQCPKCGAGEIHPRDDNKCLIRAYKVDGYSQCLVCAGYYDKDLNVVLNAEETFDRSKGWFK